MDEQDIQAGLERGLVDPEVLKSFFELNQQPIIAELTHRFQVTFAARFHNLKIVGIFLTALL